ncbi:MAG: hypothetical protein H7336_00220 [Bacteriovorax sp.]|nr:hypothetical protein [Bacteriovorax sp.]
MKITSLLSLLFLVFTISVHAESKVENFNLKMSPTRYISFELVRAKNSKLPTLLFMPGVNRGLLASDEALEKLAAQGFGVVTMNFSTQPFSVSALPKNATPDFRTTTYKLDDLNTEVIALSNELKTHFDVKTIIPVSISFSSAVSSTLQTFPLIIDAVPMTASAAVNPDLEAYITYLHSTEIFNPVFGPAITRSILDQSYASKWRTQVDSIVDEFKLNADRKSDMVEGYTVFSRASEGFVWDLTKTAKETRRVFIFARDDSPSLLKSQLQLFLKVLDTTPNALAFVVNDSGHVVSNDQPEAYVNILTYLLTKDFKAVSGIFDVKPGSDKNKIHTGAAAKKYIQDILDTL